MKEENLSAEALRRGMNTRIVGRRLMYLAETPSTMEVARQEAEEGAPEGTVIIADTQTGGRGRFQRSWVSPPGVNLYLSILLHPRLHELRQLNMVVTLAVVRAIRATAGLQATVKWPNDIHLDGLKTCGILIDSRVDSETVHYGIVGIGLNVNFDPTPYPEITALATSMMERAGRPISRMAVLRTLLQELDSLYSALQQGESVREEWRALLETLGRHVQVRWAGGVEEGLATEVDEEGNLVLERQDGSRVTMLAGEVFRQE